MGPCFTVNLSFLICKMGIIIALSQWYNAHGTVLACSRATGGMGQSWKLADPPQGFLFSPGKWVAGREEEEQMCPRLTRAAAFSHGVRIEIFLREKNPEASGRQQLVSGEWGRDVVTICLVSVCD